MAVCFGGKNNVIKLLRENDVDNEHHTWTMAKWKRKSPDQDRGGCCVSREKTGAMTRTAGRVGVCSSCPSWTSTDDTYSSSRCVVVFFIVWMVYKTTYQRFL